jgi:hypothetical protein
MRDVMHAPWICPLSTTERHINLNDSAVELVVGAIRMQILFPCLLPNH